MINKKIKSIFRLKNKKQYLFFLYKYRKKIYIKKYILVKLYKKKK